MSEMLTTSGVRSDWCQTLRFFGLSVSFVRFILADWNANLHLSMSMGLSLSELFRNSYRESFADSHIESSVCVVWVC